MMRTLPQLMILNPADAFSAYGAAKISYLSRAPIYIRLDKGIMPNLYAKEETFRQGMSLLKKGRDEFRMIQDASIPASRESCKRDL
jgi:transketolase C-terminal domain/subunit